MEVIGYLVDKKVNMIGIDRLGLGLGRNYGLIDVYLDENKTYAIENFKVYCLPMKEEGLDDLRVRVLVEF